MTRLVAVFVLAAQSMVASDSDVRADLKLIADGFTSPIALVPLNDPAGNLLVADQVGLVYIVSKLGVTRGQPFMSVLDRMAKLNQGFDERGLLGLAVHPNYSENRKFYVYYSTPLRAGAAEGWDHTSRISEFTVHTDDPERVNHASERILLEFDQPHFNHNGGCLAFGPDGYLYIASGDGGNANGIGRGHSAIGNGQDLTNLLGKILRIDVNRDQGYGIPEDNPFQAEGNRAEIYAIGLRNPWRISFDRGGEHELFAADIGQTLYEEVNIIERGANYGWNIREGFHCFDPQNPLKAPEECPEEDIRGNAFADPAFVYKNVNGFRGDADALGISITGGYVYRGQQFPSLVGKYVFADWSQNMVVPLGRLLVATRTDSGSWTVEKLRLTSQKKETLDMFVTALGEDEDGELYVLTNGRNGQIDRTGKVFKLIAD